MGGGYFGCGFAALGFICVEINCSLRIARTQRQRRDMFIETSLHASRERVPKQQVQPTGGVRRFPNI
jgi:hypothetical protein